MGEAGESTLEPAGLRETPPSLSVPAPPFPTCHTALGQSCTVLVSLLSCLSCHRIFFPLDSSVAATRRLLGAWTAGSSSRHIRTLCKDRCKDKSYFPLKWICLKAGLQFTGVSVPLPLTVSRVTLICL